MTGLVAISWVFRISYATLFPIGLSGLALLRFEGVVILRGADVNPAVQVKGQSSR